MISAMCDLMVGVFEHLDITSIMNVDVMIKYTEHIMRGPTLKKHRKFLEERK